MKIMTGIISTTILLAGCSTIVNETVLEEKDGVIYRQESTRPYSGNVFDSWENGNSKIEGSYKKGKQDGPWTWWYYNGQEMCKGTFKNGRRKGIWTWWFENGQKSREETYRNGLLHGKSTMWSENGGMLGESLYKDGELVRE